MPVLLLQFAHTEISDLSSTVFRVSTSSLVAAACARVWGVSIAAAVGSSSWSKTGSSGEWMRADGDSWLHSLGESFLRGGDPLSMRMGATKAGLPCRRLVCMCDSLASAVLVFVSWSERADPGFRM